MMNETTLGTLGSFPRARRTKCSHTSKRSRTESKKKRADMFVAFDRTEEKSTSPTHAQHISDKKEFGRVYVPTHIATERSSKGRIDTYLR